MTSFIGATIGGYVIKEQLGVGGMGAVFFAQMDNRPPVALKVLQVGGGQELKAASKRFLDEATAATAIESEYLVPILSSGFDETCGPYIVYEYVPGGSLREKLNKKGKLTKDEVLEELAPSLLGALADLHECEVFHRDVKPDNILCCGNGKYLLGDLGLATFEGRQAKTRTGTFVGTPGYIAPERLKSERDDNGKLADIYAAAVVLVETLTGTSPFRARRPVDVVKEQMTRVVKPAELTAIGVPKQMASVLARALSIEPSQRPQSCKDFLVGLQEDLSHFVAKTQLNVAAPEVKSPILSKRRPYLARFVALVALVLVFYQMYSGTKPQSANNMARVVGLEDRFLRWTNEIHALRKEPKANPKALRRLRDIHRSFHRLVDYSSPDANLVSFEAELLRTYYELGLWKTNLLADVLVESSSHLFSLERSVRLSADWIACWHIHLLLRLRNARNAKSKKASLAIEAALESHLLLEGVTASFLKFIEKIHRELTLQSPQITAVKEYTQVLNVARKGAKQEFENALNLGRKLDSSGLNKIPGQRTESLSQLVVRRDTYCDRVLETYWLSKSQFAVPLLFDGALSAHLRSITEVFRARWGLSKKLLTNPDYDWGPNFDERFFIEDSLVMFRAVAWQSRELKGLDAWISDLEIHDETRNLMKMVSTVQQKVLKTGLLKEVLPAFPENSPPCHHVEDTNHESGYIR